MSLLVCNTILQTPTTMSLLDKSNLFMNTTHVWLDGVARDKTGDDGKVGPRLFVYVCVCVCMFAYVCVCMCMYVYACVCM